jgi:Ser/Thr protein kinase RdoA (MazF antagonist)
VEHDPDHGWRPSDVGPLLAELHAELRGFPGELPTAAPLDVAPAVAYLRSVGEPGCGDADLADLVADAERVAAELATADAVPLHGDAHPGNLMRTPNGPVWTDFEDSWRGPVGWDLACLACTGRLDGWAAVAGYPAAPDRAVLAPWVAARRLQGVVWSLVFAHRFPQRRADALARWREWRAGG